MLTVVRVKPQFACDALYDNYGDKVLVHSHSALAISLTKQLDDKKKILAEKVTREVFIEYDIKWHSRNEINKIIKIRLREQFQKGSMNNMVEISDLEANFLRVPLSMVLDSITKQVSHYVKHCTEKTLSQQQETACLRKKGQVDNLESPFDVTDKYINILSLLNSSIEI